MEMGDVYFVYISWAFSRTNSDGYSNIPAGDGIQSAEPWRFWVEKSPRSPVGDLLHSRDTCVHPDPASFCGRCGVVVHPDPASIADSRRVRYDEPCPGMCMRLARRAADAHVADKDAHFSIALADLLGAVAPHVPPGKHLEETCRTAHPTAAAVSGKEGSLDAGEERAEGLDSFQKPERRRYAASSELGRQQPRRRESRR
mmetsp:Transcript_24358/g.39190  ORF Transcript_24358/g.39190 Transcript_24358/m.39190 type:complete len:200 (-) Transcript_24358:2028-2627(-)